MNTTDTGMGSDVEQVTDQYVVVLIIRVLSQSEMRASGCKVSILTSQRSQKKSQIMSRQWKKKWRSKLPPQIIFHRLTILLMVPKW